MLIAILLTVLAMALAWAGFAFAGRFRRPRLFRIGAGAAALGLLLLWLLPWMVMSRGLEPAMPLFIGAMVIAVSTLGGGLTAMARSSSGYQESELDRIIQTSDPYDEFP